MEEFLTISCGEEHIHCRSIFTYHSPLYNKDYYVFQIIGTDDVSILEYHLENGKRVYNEVSSDDEWIMLEKIVNNYFDLGNFDNQSSCATCHQGNCKNCHH